MKVISGDLGLKDLARVGLDTTSDFRSYFNLVRVTMSGLPLLAVLLDATGPQDVLKYFVDKVLPGLVARDDFITLTGDLTPALADRFGITTHTTAAVWLASPAYDKYATYTGPMSSITDWLPTMTLVPGGTASMQTFEVPKEEAEELKATAEREITQKTMYCGVLFDL